MHSAMTRQCQLEYGFWQYPEAVHANPEARWVFNKPFFFIVFFFFFFSSISSCLKQNYIIKGKQKTSLGQKWASVERGRQVKEQLLCSYTGSKEPVLAWHLHTTTEAGNAENRLILRLLRTIGLAAVKKPQFSHKAWKLWHTLNVHWKSV